MLGYTDVKWKKNKTYIWNKATGHSIVPVMYRIKYADGSFSDCYNLARAKDNLVKDIVEEYNKSKTPFKTTEGAIQVAH